MIIPAFPATLQPRILNELHNTHIGTEKMKMLARSYCYWQGIDKDIENLVKACEPCSSVKKIPVRLLYIRGKNQTKFGKESTLIMQDHLWVIISLWLWMLKQNG